MFLPRSPLSPLRVLARLACLIHAANVHSEPGSNPFGICFETLPNIPSKEDASPGLSTGLIARRTFDDICLMFRRTGCYPPSKNTIGTDLRTSQQPHQYGKADSQNHPTRLSKNIHRQAQRVEPTGEGTILVAAARMSTGRRKFYIGPATNKKVSMLESCDRISDSRLCLVRVGPLFSTFAPTEIDKTLEIGCVCRLILNRHLQHQVVATVDCKICCV